MTLPALLLSLTLVALRGGGAVGHASPPEVVPSPSEAPAARDTKTKTRPKTKKRAPGRRQPGRITRKQSADAYRWVAHVRYRLFREWRAPLLAPAVAKLLVADVEIGFDERGVITSWTLSKRATGEGSDAFNTSLEKLGAKVKRLAKPNTAALALFLRRKVTLRFRADSPLVRAL